MTQKVRVYCGPGTLYEHEGEDLDWKIDNVDNLEIKDGDLTVAVYRMGLWSRIVRMDERGEL